MSTKIKIACTQKDSEGKVLFTVCKEDTVKGEVNNVNLTAFVVNVLALSCQMAKLTGTNKPKLSKPIEVEYSIGGKKSTLELKFSLSEKRIEIIKGRLPQIFLTAYRMHTLKFSTKETYVSSMGKLVYAAKQTRKEIKEVAATTPELN